ncbi:hydroxymyristoyl-ACP dehydratase [Ramlibacter sp. AW1]|uniref:Hydroxymyristoyl-ACP dehydratase n=1 Tax=Ramlibacter aurantiacus TaxID=2801330 RepID=A0A937D335_9BURK|nr:hydroxymyristoyl-ACP dehydratase [Ramlibacter aurantiacus]MBL0418897.1 hydroxymyristoyl-ACP dehydratase [Ramlibacter aurantiacus]
MTLGHDDIAALIPHSGRMCLLESVLGWDDAGIRCLARSHTDPDNPLRSRSGLLATAGIEYAAQAAAVHGGLRARASGRSAAPGFLASARGVRLHRLRLDDLPGELSVQAEHLAGTAEQLLYTFELRHDGQPVLDGRLAVVLNMALPA